MLFFQTKLWHWIGDSSNNLIIIGSCWARISTTLASFGECGIRACGNNKESRFEKRKRGLTLFYSSIFPHKDITRKEERCVIWLNLIIKKFLLPNFYGCFIFFCYALGSFQQSLCVLYAYTFCEVATVIYL